MGPARSRLRHRRTFCALSRMQGRGCLAFQGFARMCCSKLAQWQRLSSVSNGADMAHMLMRGAHVRFHAMRQWKFFSDVMLGKNCAIWLAEWIISEDDVATSGVRQD